MAKRQKQNSDVVVVGSSNTDLVIESAKLPEPGMTVLGGKYQIVSGGKGANQAVAAARTGAQVIFVANIGCDDFGDNAMARLDREGIGTKPGIEATKTCPTNHETTFPDTMGPLWGPRKIPLKAKTRKCLRAPLK